MSDFQEAKKQENKKTVNISHAHTAEEKKLEQKAASCPNCGASIPEGALFCPECGADLNIPAFCPNCGAKTFSGADICEVCKTWLLEGQCKFCYTELAPNAAFCPECGNPKDGIRCPNCGSLSIFDFCTKCGKPLTEDAVKTVELAKDDPDAQAVIDAIEQTVGIESELAEIESLINSEPPADTAPPVIDLIPSVETAPLVETARPPTRRERFSDRQMAAISNTEKNMEAAAIRREEEEKKILEEAIKREAVQERQIKILEAKALEEARMREEQERLAKIRDAIARKEALEREKEKAVSAAIAASEKCREKRFPSHQDARRYHNAMRPGRTSGWLCNYSGTVHDDGPNGCAEPALGGYWV